MEIIQKLLHTEEISYSSNLNEESLKSKLDELFKQKTVQVGGKRNSENRFTAYDQWTVISWDMPYLKRKAAYLYGKIESAEKGTLLKLKVKPNSILPIFALLSFILGSIVSLQALSVLGETKFKLVIGITFIVFGIIYYPLSLFFKNRLRNKIVGYLNLNLV